MAHLDPKRRRDRRLELTSRVIRRRRELHDRTFHPPSLTRSHCRCDEGYHFLGKKRPLSCSCRKHRKGRPRISSGMCSIGERDRIYEWRREARDLAIAVRGGRGFEEVERGWNSTKRGPRIFTVEKVDIDRTGIQWGGWHVYRRYHTAHDRDNALAALRKNTRDYAIRNYQAGQEGVYTGPGSLFRPGRLNEL